MKKLLFRCLLFCGVIVGILSTIHAQTPTLSPNDWKKIDQLSDEFTSTSTPIPPDGDLWLVDDRLTYERDRFFLRRENAFVSDNTLKLLTKKERIVEEGYDWSNLCAPRTYYYTAAKVFTKYRMKPGAYYEIRAKIPDSKNSVGQSFWFVRGSAAGTYSEIDVFETEAQIPRYYPSALHHGPEPCSGIYDYNQDKAVWLPDDLSEEFHVFGLDWQTDALRFYVDDRLLYEMTDLTNPNNTNPSCYPTPIPSIPVAGLFSQYGQLGARAVEEYEGQIEPTAAGDAFEIDYYRVYLRKPTITLVSQTCTLGTNTRTYRAHTGVPDDVIVWDYDSNIFPNAQINEVIAQGYSEITLEINPSNPQQTLRAKVIRPIEKGFPGGGQSFDFESDFTDPIIIGNYNPDFHFEDVPPLFNVNGDVHVLAVSPNIHSRWDLSEEVAPGVWQWQANKFGTNATFENLKHNTNYRIKHGEYGGCTSWVEKTRTFTMTYSADFVHAEPENMGNGYFRIPSAAGLRRSANERWSIAKVVNGTPGIYTQVQTNWIASFSNLRANTTYSLKHEILVNNVVVTAEVKEVFVKANADFTFAIPNEEPWVEDLNITRGAGKTLVTVQAEGNNRTDQWYLHEIDLNGNIINPAIEGPIFGRTATFREPLPHGRYMFKHGVYHGSLVPWTETRRVLQISAKKYRNISGQGDVELLPYSKQSTKSYFYLPVDSYVSVQRRVQTSGGCSPTYNNVPLSGYIKFTNLDDGSTIDNPLDPISEGTYDEIENVFMTSGYYQVVFGQLGSSEELLITDLITSFDFDADGCPINDLTINGVFDGVTDDWETGMPGSAGDGTDRFYKFNLERPGEVTFSTCNSSPLLNTRLELFHANGQKMKFANGNSFTLDYFNDDACGQLSTINSAYLPEGYYYVVVDAPLGTTQPFVLNIDVEECTPPQIVSGPPNDDPQRLAIETANTFETSTLEEVRVWPNPATNDLYLDGLETGAYYQIFDMSGKRVIENTYEEGQVISIEALIPGLYFIQCEKEGEQKTLKFSVIR